MDLRLELDEVYKGCEKILDTGYGQFKLIVLQVLDMALSLIMAKDPMQYDNLSRRFNCKMSCV